jgi:hypothetical protein
MSFYEQYRIYCDKALQEKVAGKQLAEGVFRAKKGINSFIVEKDEEGKRRMHRLNPTPGQPPKLNPCEEHLTGMDVTNSVVVFT